MKLSEIRARNAKIVEAYRQGVRLREIAANFGVHTSTVCRAAYAAGLKRGWGPPKTKNVPLYELAAKSLKMEFGWGELKRFAVDNGFSIYWFYTVRATLRRKLLQQCQG